MVSWLPRWVHPTVEDGAGRNASCLHAAQSLGGFNTNSALPFPPSWNKFLPRQTALQPAAERGGRRQPEQAGSQPRRHHSIFRLIVEDHSNLTSPPRHRMSTHPPHSSKKTKCVECHQKEIAPQNSQEPTLRGCASQQRWREP